MNHPYEQLADLVDGTLDEDDLAGVQAHLDTCASCREDLAHATAGREAARSLPQATPPARPPSARRRRGRRPRPRGPHVVPLGGRGRGRRGGRRDRDRASQRRGKRKARRGGLRAERAGGSRGGRPGSRWRRIVPKLDENYDAKELERLARDTRSEIAAQQPAPQADALDTGRRPVRESGLRRATGWPSWLA